MICESLSVAKNGHLQIGGVDTVELAKEFGTPLYVYDEATIRKACREYKNSIEKYYNGNGLVLYASKAFSCLEMYRIVAEEGLGVDTVSGGEIYTALKAGFPAEKIFFHGNNKTYDELIYAVKNGIGCIVVDNIEEIKTLGQIGQSLNKTIKIMLRIKPGIDAHTHEFIRTGQIDSKFGFSLETGEAIETVKMALEQKHLNLAGFHCHIGSQIFSTDPFCLAAKVMAGFMAEVKQKFGLTTTELNLGGGFGIKYVEDDTPKDYSDYMEQVSTQLKNTCTELDLPMPRVYIEPGRSIVGPAGITLYTVGGVKTIPNVRTYVSVDGGMTDNPRYALYRSKYEILIANKADKNADFIATVAGKCCESGDLIQEHALIQKPEVGDIMAVLATGAYNYSMSSNYNRIPRPAAVMIKDGKPRLIIKRETYEHIVRNDI